ncbi:MAG: beta/gamma crystallin-related protein [Thermoplasmatota archaeon]
MSIVTLWEKRNFKGQSISSNSDSSWVGRAFNDRASAVRISEGEWIFFEHVSYNRGKPKGRKWSLRAGSYPDIKKSHGIPDNKISSYKRNWLYKDPAYQSIWAGHDATRAKARLDAENLAAQARELERESGSSAQEAQAHQAELANLRGTLAKKKEALRKAIADQDEAKNEAVRYEKLVVAEERQYGVVQDQIDQSKAEAEQMEIESQGFRDEASADRQLEDSVRAEVAEAERQISQVIIRSDKLRAKTAEYQAQIIRVVEESPLNLDRDLGGLKAREAGVRQAAVDQIRLEGSQDLEERIVRLQALHEEELAEALANVSAEAAEAMERDLQNAMDQAVRDQEAAVAAIDDEFASPGVRKAAEQGFSDSDSRMRSMLDTNPRLAGRGNEISDGRRTKMALAVVSDQDGNAVSGHPVRLYDEHERLVDRTRTNAGGIAILLFPRGNTSASTGVIEAGRLASGLVKAVFKIPEESQHAFVSIVVDQLGPLESHAAVDPLPRLPSVFSPSLYDDLLRLNYACSSPLLPQLDLSDGNGAGRTRTVRRLKMTRVSPVSEEGLPRRRYLVTVRQEWAFVGYSLGSLANLQSLAPGQVLRESKDTVERIKSRAEQVSAQAIEDIVSTAEQAAHQANTVESLLSEASHMANRTNASTETNVSSTAVTAGASIPFVASVAVAHSSSRASTTAQFAQALSSSAVASSTTDATQEASAVMAAAESRINNQVKKTQATIKSLETALVRTIDQISPLLSRATNLLKWTVYENFLVLSHVEDVKEIYLEHITSVPRSPGTLFDATNILDFMSFFAPDILDQSLLMGVASLRDQVAQGGGAEHPIVQHVNRNRTYYLGLLLNAAMDVPALRDDAPQLRRFGAGHQLWRLPIMGFVGDRALITRDVRSSDAFARQLLSDPGSATTIRVASQGTYGEVLQGLHSLAELEGVLPPGLQRPVHVVPGDYRLLDLANVGPSEPAPHGLGESGAAKGLEDSPSLGDAKEAPPLNGIETAETSRAVGSQPKSAIPDIPATP